MHLILATVFFAIQIYCDFSGYSDIAIGAARILGFDLMQNFRQPYFSRSIREFWRRWHISLSTWFRDYLYFPLGGNRVSIPRNYINLLIVFVASGLWHGANWTFLIWGMLHGLYIVVEAIIEKRLEHQNSQFIGKSWHWVGILLTFGLVTFAWIFFRANSISDAFYIIAHLFDLSNGMAHIAAPFNAIAPLAIGEIDLVMACFTILILIIYDGLANRAVSRSIPISITRPWRWLLYYAAVFLILYSASTSQPAFIYFQF
ncbi:MAG: hypothetical protein L6Q98_06030 [Anaerolineae bacterium]|nr:hypothetical protein [Anaerolineae bacterium]